MFTNHNYQHVPSVPTPVAMAQDATGAHAPTLPQQSQAPMHSPIFGATPEVIRRFQDNQFPGYTPGFVPPHYASGNISVSGMPARWQQMFGSVTDSQPISVPTRGRVPTPAQVGGIPIVSALTS